MPFSYSVCTCIMRLWFLQHSKKTINMKDVYEIHVEWLMQSIYNLFESQMHILILFGILLIYF